MGKFRYKPSQERVIRDEEDDFGMSDYNRYNYSEDDYEEDDQNQHLKNQRNSKNRKMEYLKKIQGTSIIPKGTYCYSEKTCPYWDLFQEKPKQMNGFCWFLNKGDWDEGMTELWDQIKNCNVNK